MAHERKLDQLREIFASGDKTALIDFVKNSQELEPNLVQELLSLFRSKSERKEEEEDEEEEEEDDDEDEDDEEEDEELYWTDTGDYHFPTTTTTTSAQRLLCEPSPSSPSLLIKPSVIHVQEAISPNRSTRNSEQFPLGDRIHRSPRSLSVFTYQSTIAKKEKAEREAMEAAAFLRRSGVFGRMIFVSPFRPPTFTPLSPPSQHNEQETQADLFDTFVDYQECGFCHDLVSFQKFCPYCNRGEPLHNVVKRFNIGRIIASPKATTL